MKQTKYDVFLDPKNPQAIKVQKEKLDCLLTQYKNIIIIDNLEACKNFTVDFFRNKGIQHSSIVLY